MNHSFHSSLLATDFSKKDNVIGAVQNAWRQRDSLKFYLERQWYQSIAWYMGHQYLFWDDSRNTLVKSDAPSYRARMVVNLMLPAVRTLAARLYSGEPEWDVLPATNDSMDMQTAEISKQLLSSNWHNMRMPEKILRVINWMLLTGNGFVKQLWDANAGPPVFIPDAEGDYEYDEELNVGDIAAYVVSPFDLIIDPHAGDDFTDAQWVIESKLVHVEEARAKYPEARNIKPESAVGNDRVSTLGQRLKTMLPAGQGRKMNPLVYASPHEKNDAIVIHELWIKPYATGRFKNGYHAVIAGDKLLFKGDHPYMHRDLPYVHFREIAVPGRVWGTSTTEQLIPLQQSYNRTKSQIIENRNLIANPKWLVPKGSGVKNTAMTGEPGEKVEHNPGFAPEPLNPPSIPPYVERILGSDRVDMEDISGVHEVSRAEAPGDVRGTGGIAMLLERDEDNLNTIRRNIELGIEKLGRQNLQLSAQFVREERLAKVLGSNDELLLFTYSGRDIAGANSALPGVTYFDVRVKTRAGLPYSRAAQQQLVTELVSQGILQPQNNPDDKRFVLQLLSLGDARNHLDQARVHRGRQLKEIQEMTEGLQPRVESHHNHAVHIEELKRFMNSARYDMLEPELKARFKLHLQQHEQFEVMEAIKPQILMEQALAMQSNNMAAGQQPQLGASNGQEEQARSQQQRRDNGSQPQEAPQRAQL